MNPPPGTWHSPFSNSKLNAEDLVRELALGAVAKILMLGLLGYESENVLISANAIHVHAKTFPYRGMMPFPPGLMDYVQSECPHWLNVFMDEFGISDALDGILPRKIPDGEKLGGLYRHFRVMHQLCQVSSQLGWPEGRILGIHGFDSPDLTGRLISAGIMYLLVWREEHMKEAVELGGEETDEMWVDYLGTGSLKNLNLTEAETLGRDAFARQSNSTRLIFNLTRPWCVDSWSSNHPRFL